MSRGWGALLVAGAFVLSVGIGLVAGIYGRNLRAMYASDELRLRIAAWFVTVMLLAFIVAGIARGLEFATRKVLPVAAVLAVVAAVIVVIAGVGTGRGALLALMFVTLAAFIVVLSVPVRAIAGTAGKVFFALVAVAGGLAGGATGGGLVAATIAIGAMVMARRSAKVEGDYPLLARTIAAIASRGGTRFCNANLAGANLADAQLVACDFRGAELTGAHFDRATVRLCRFDRGSRIS